MRLESILINANPEMKKTLGGDISKFNKISLLFEQIMNKVGMIEKTMKIYCTDKQLTAFMNWNAKIEEVDSGL